MNDGVYAFPGAIDGNKLHLIRKFDGRGAPSAHDFITTSDTGGVRSEIDLAENESAVIEVVPATIRSNSPVNARVTHYDGSTLAATLSGTADATLEFFVGTSYPDKRNSVLTDGGMNPAAVGVGDAYRITINGNTTTIEERDGMLSVPLPLTGTAVNLAIEREPQAIPAAATNGGGM